MSSNGPLDLIKLLVLPALPAPGVHDDLEIVKLDWDVTAGIRMSDLADRHLVAFLPVDSMSNVDVAHPATTWHPPHAGQEVYIRIRWPNAIMPKTIEESHDSYQRELTCSVDISSKGDGSSVGDVAHSNQRFLKEHVQHGRGQYHTSIHETNGRYVKSSAGFERHPIILEAGEYKFQAGYCHEEQGAWYGIAFDFTVDEAGSPQAEVRSNSPTVSSATSTCSICKKWTSGTHQKALVIEEWSSRMHDHLCELGTMYRQNDTLWTLKSVLEQGLDITDNALIRYNDEYLKDRGRLLRDCGMKNQSQVHVVRRDNKSAHDESEDDDSSGGQSGYDPSPESDGRFCF
ncbi:hypothetical protein F5Y18DRAFT_432050 [Xylariaceae sp. FL1019]|nr:hypothetical protein F5Y18DRAFT_432050 [Xylariaceae sp. FL1019]